MICYSTDLTQLNDDQKKEYEFKTRFHSEYNINDDIRKTNCSSAYYKINNELN